MKIKNCKLKICFFGSSNYCLPILKILKPQLKLIVTREDKPVGRKQILTPSATKTWAEKNNIPVNVILAASRILNCDLGLVADFGQVLPEEIFNKPRLGIFNIHFSKLPDLRGASPVQQTILRGDTTAWVTILKIEKTLDTGPALDQRSFPILPDDTTESLYTRLFEEVAKYITTLDFSAKLTPQSGTPTYCKKLTKEDGFVEFSRLLEPRTYNLFRAMYPWPGIWTIKDGKRLKILKCHLGDNRLIIDEVQFEGKKPQLFIS